jgi:hypothetical protein
VADASANGFGLAYPDVFVTAGSPATVTAQRTVAGGTVTVGVYVVEFDPAYVRVQQGTFALAAANAGPVTPGIANVDSRGRPWSSRAEQFPATTATTTSRSRARFQVRIYQLPAKRQPAQHQWPLVRSRR